MARLISTFSFQMCKKDNQKDSYHKLEKIIISTILAYRMKMLTARLGITNLKGKHQFEL